MKVLITGGAGFIGSHLAEELLIGGDEVTAIDNLSTGRLSNIEGLRSNPGFRFELDTIMNEKKMDELIQECDLVFHLAAAVGVKLIINKPVESIETNVLGAEMVLKVANRHRKKVVMTSSSEVYGKGNTVPFREGSDHVYGPTTKSRWSYACSKRIDEFLSLAYWHEKQLPVVIVRLFNTVGPRQTGRYGMVIPTFVRQALMNRPITVYGDGQQTRSFSYVGDVIQGMISLSREPKAVSDIFNIGNTEEISIGDLASMVKEMTRSKSRIVFVPYDQAYEKGFEDMRKRIPDITKIQNLVGYKPTTNLAEILAEVIRFYKD